MQICEPLKALVPQRQMTRQLVCIQRQELHLRMELARLPQKRRAHSLERHLQLQMVHQRQLNCEQSSGLVLRLVHHHHLFHSTSGNLELLTETVGRQLEILQQSSTRTLEMPVLQEMVKQAHHHSRRPSEQRALLDLVPIRQLVYILLQEAQLVQEAANHQQLSSRRLSERHQLLEPELRIIQSSMQILEQLKVRARRQLATKH
jgi:hypothetical protein